MNNKINYFNLKKILHGGDPVNESGYYMVTFINNMYVDNRAYDVKINISRNTTPTDIINKIVNLTDINSGDWGPTGYRGYRSVKIYFNNEKFTQRHISDLLTQSKVYLNPRLTYMVVAVNSLDLAVQPPVQPPVEPLGQPPVQPPVQPHVQPPVELSGQPSGETLLHNCTIRCYGNGQK